MAVILDGEYRTELEVLVAAGAVLDVRPATGNAEPYVLSPAFVNAHSHLEYYGLGGQIPAGEWLPWIRTLTQLKATQAPETVRADCRAAAAANRASGVALIGEHASRPGPAEAMAAEGLDGIVFQETITFFERDDPSVKLASVAREAETSRRSIGTVNMSPHAVYTVDDATLRWFGSQPGPLSIHAAETEAENELMACGSGPLAEVERRAGFEPVSRGGRVIPYLRDVGLLRPDVQLVHVCAVDGDDVEMIAASGASVAHCPRSNAALGCPRAPIAELLRRDVRVGLGTDSAASSGDVDMFAEMRAACAPGVTDTDVWRMATSLGAASLGRPDWTIAPGHRVPLIALHDDRMTSLAAVIQYGRPEIVRWI